MCEVTNNKNYRAEVRALHAEVLHHELERKLDEVTTARESELMSLEFKLRAIKVMNLVLVDVAQALSTLKGHMPEDGSDLPVGTGADPDEDHPWYQYWNAAPIVRNLLAELEEVQASMEMGTSMIFSKTSDFLKERHEAEHGPMEKDEEVEEEAPFAQILRKVMMN